MKVAQLIKLHEYISRYEQNPYRYPGQFIKLKKENWQKKLHRWEQDQNQMFRDAAHAEQEEQNEKRSWLPWLSRQKEAEIDPTDTPVAVSHAATEEALKHEFLEELYAIQLGWATSTVAEFSFLDERYKKDAVLRYFLKRVPDTYLLMYEPVFHLSQTTMETNSILISPLGAEIIHMLEDRPGVLFWAREERTWQREEQGEFTTILNPMLALNRTERVLKSIFKKYEIDFPIRKVIISRENQIRVQHLPANTEIISASMHQQWLLAKREENLALKRLQLRAAEVLLMHAETTAVKRPVWDTISEDEEIF